MKIQNSKELSELAERYGMSSEVFAQGIIKNAQFVGVLPKQDSHIFFGMSILELCGSVGISLTEFVAMVMGKGSTIIENIVSSFILVGDGECPDCGGHMELTSAEYIYKQFGYDSEPEIVGTNWERKLCKVCGHSQIN